MSKLYDIREALKAAIVAADIGWPERAVVIKRQGSVLNDISTAIAQCANKAVLHIGVASGKFTDGAELDGDIIIPLTIIAAPQIKEGAVPEEDLWEKLIKLVHGLKLSPRDHYNYRFRVQDFEDVEVELDKTPYLGRVTKCAYRLSL